MQFVRGNLALRDHADNGEDIYLLSKRPRLRYSGNWCSPAEPAGGRASWRNWWSGVLTPAYRVSGPLAANGET
jgi:hypothetical protein